MPQRTTETAASKEVAALTSRMPREHAWLELDDGGYPMGFVRAGVTDAEQKNPFTEIKYHVGVLLLQGRDDGLAVFETHVTPEGLSNHRPKGCSSYCEGVSFRRTGYGLNQDVEILGSWRGESSSIDPGDIALEGMRLMHVLGPVPSDPWAYNFAHVVGTAHHHWQHPEVDALRTSWAIV
ncbi:MAG TPA: hypothetical protein VLF91_06530 [Candidatus Saccharimonadales bacterium]|nr:hypothetical protein [Candidatus Saccharimonadales bacterium]